MSAIPAAPPPSLGIPPHPSSSQIGVGSRGFRFSDFARLRRCRRSPRFLQPSACIFSQTPRPTPLCSPIFHPRPPKGTQKNRQRVASLACSQQLGGFFCQRPPSRTHSHPRSIWNFTICSLLCQVQTAEEARAFEQ